MISRSATTRPGSSSAGRPRLGRVALLGASVGLLGSLLVAATAAAVPSAQPSAKPVVKSITVTGPANRQPLTFRADRQPDQYGALLNEVAWMDGQPPDILSSTPADLGPRYTVTVFVGGKVTARYDLYPDVKGGPRAHRLAVGSTKAAWFFAPVDMSSTLAAVGVKLPSSVSTEGVMSNQPKATPLVQSITGILKEGVSALALAGLGCLAILVLLGAAARRSRAVDRRRTMPPAIARLNNVRATAAAGPGARVRPAVPAGRLPGLLGRRAIADRLAAIKRLPAGPEKHTGSRPASATRLMQRIRVTAVSASARAAAKAAQVGTAAKAAQAGTAAEAPRAGVTAGTRPGKPRLTWPFKQKVRPAGGPVVATAPAPASARVEWADQAAATSSRGPASSPAPSGAPTQRSGAATLVDTDTRTLADTGTRPADPSPAEIGEAAPDAAPETDSSSPADTAVSTGPSETGAETRAAGTGVTDTSTADTASTIAASSMVAGPDKPGGPGVTDARGPGADARGPGADGPAESTTPSAHAERDSPTAGDAIQPTTGMDAAPRTTTSAETEKPVETAKPAEPKPEPAKATADGPDTGADDRDAEAEAVTTGDVTPGGGTTGDVTPGK